MTEAPVVHDDVVLQVRDLHVSFHTGGGEVRAVRGLDLELRRGEIVGIVGESGSGKSTASLALLGLLPDTATVRGKAILHGTDLTRLSRARLDAQRGNRIAMIYQDPMTALNPVQRIGAQIAEAYRAHHSSASRAEANTRAVEMLDLVGIPGAESRARSYPHEFSGGMRQRAVIAMALVNDPDVLVADEPTTALDVTVQAQVLELVLDLCERLGVAVLLITHDLGVIARVADRVVVMYAGRPVELAGVDELFARPAMPYTTALLQALPGTTGRHEPLHPIPGQPPSMVRLPAGCPFQPRCPKADDLCEREEPALSPVGDAHLAACHHPDHQATELARTGAEA
ncbi:MAG: ATP-binding cassette domain-containing protein [Streptosporangiales bacterium]|nr:ATP-binding cassette domain-containing protein [Streptosporangiales bacterium]